MDHQELSDLLLRFGVDCRSWGVPGSGTKSLAKLSEELALGESRLVVDDKRVLREVAVLNLRVYCGDECLAEDRQIFHDEREFRRDYSHLSEKFSPATESLASAIARTLREEIGYEGRYELRSEPQESVSDDVSKRISYPGLNSRYRVWTAEVEIPLGAKDQLRLVERDDKKTTYFVWQRNRP